MSPRRRSCDMAQVFVTDAYPRPIRPEQRVPPAVPVRIQDLPGYVVGLHERRSDTHTCALCDIVWPCLGARTQFIDARRFTCEFWFDTKRWQDILASSERNTAAESARKIKKTSDGD